MTWQPVAALSRKRGVSVATEVAKAESGGVPAAPDAAAEWQEVVHPESGQTYFFNATTGETSWERPA